MSSFVRPAESVHGQKSHLQRVALALKVAATLENILFGRALLHSWEQSERFQFLVLAVRFFPEKKGRLPEQAAEMSHKKSIV